jgi:hypothetical protein
MQRFSRTFLMLALPGLLASCESMRNAGTVFRESFATFRENKLLITTHVQTTQIEHPREVMKLPIRGQQMIFKKSPEFSQRSISAFEPFEAENPDDGYGALLQLDTKGRNALDLASREYRGSVMLTMVNATPVDMVEIDQPITDGRFTIWRGLTKKTIDEMDKFYPRLKYLKSTSRLMEGMLPSTGAEKLNSVRDARAMEAAEKAAARDKERGKLPPAPKPRKDIIPLDGYKLPGT